MKRITFMCAYILLGSLLMLKAQTKGVETSFERGVKGEYAFYADNPFYCPCTVELTFSKLENVSFNSVNIDVPFQAVVHRGKQRILTLSRMVDDEPIDFRYSYSSIKGNVKASVDTDFVYLLPVKPGRKVCIDRTVSMENFLGAKTAARTTGFIFNMEEGDTVYACRAGIVSEVQDKSASTREHTRYSAHENFVEIYHQDGSFSQYKLFKDDGIFVEVGEKVLAGQPVGVIGGSNYEHGSHLRYYTYHLYRDDSAVDKDGYPSPLIRSKIFIPTFHLGPDQEDKPIFNQSYTSEHPVKLLLKEMSKSQKKKYLKEHSLK